MVQATDRKGAAQEAASPLSARVPTLAELAAGFQAWLKAAGYDAVTRPTLTFELPDGRPAVFPLLFKLSAVSALTGECREMADSILAVLAEAGPGVMVKGIDIAAGIGDECEHTAGTFRRAVIALKADDLIATAATGYCLVRPA